MLDEPVGGIDHATTGVIMDLTEALHKTRGLTILMVSHHILSLRGRADEIVWVSERKLVCGPADLMLSKENIEEMLLAVSG